MAESFNTATAEPATQVRPKKQSPKSKRQPRYQVILWNDDDHTYQYVIYMMKKIFGHVESLGMKIASEVDRNGRAICLTTTREHAELKRDQIHAFGRDDLLDRCKGSMSATIEPEPGS
jgi:ATP-dependent Clp protease adaptor protein ClpS